MGAPENVSSCNGYARPQRWRRAQGTHARPRRHPCAQRIRRARGWFRPLTPARGARSAGASWGRRTARSPPSPHRARLADRQFDHRGVRSTGACPPRTGAAAGHPGRPAARRRPAPAAREASRSEHHRGLCRPPARAVSPRGHRGDGGRPGATRGSPVRGRRRRRLAQHPGTAAGHPARIASSSRRASESRASGAPRSGRSPRGSEGNGWNRNNARRVAKHSGIEPPARPLRADATDFEDRARHQSSRASGGERSAAPRRGSSVRARGMT